MSDTQNSDLAFPRFENIYCASDCCWIYLFLPAPWIVILHALLHLFKDWISELSDSKTSLDCCFHSILPLLLMVTSVRWSELRLQWFLRQLAHVATKNEFCRTKVAHKENTSTATITW